MTVTTLLPGVDQHRDAYRVRLSFPGLGRHVETGIPTPNEANARILELRRLRDAGLRPDVPAGELTLREAAEALLARKRVTGKRRKLTAGGIRHWERSLLPWREGPFALLPVSLLRRDRLEDALLARAALTPTAAKFEREGLIAVLDYAAARGATFDAAILRIPPIPTSPRERRALSVQELELLAVCAPDYGQRMLLFKGTVGLRISELFGLTDRMLDLDAGELHLPASLTKEHRAKTVPLTLEEVSLLRHQLVARAPGARHVFCKRSGKPWAYRHWRKLIWDKTLTRAQSAWRAEHDLDAEAVTPFCDLTPHDLRSTAATLMRDAGFTREEAAARLGHADTGQLLDRVYDQGDRAARARRGVQRAAPEGLRAVLGRDAQQSVTPAARPAILEPR